MIEVAVYILFSTMNSMHTHMAKDRPREKKKKRKGKDAEKKIKREKNSTGGSRTNGLRNL